MHTYPPIVALMTDFGVKDIFVGTMKGVILGIAPCCTPVDLTHGLAPQSVLEACFQLEAAYAFFPVSTLFCCVVDPGVGTARKALAVRTERYTFVAPDNGLLTLVLRRENVVECVQLDNPAMHLPVVSSTFHGRDVFAPAVAHLAAGVPIGELGSAVDIHELVRLKEVDPVRTPEGWRGVVVGADHFGNLVTNIAGRYLAGSVRVEVDSVVVDTIARTFADTEAGRPVVYAGSAGYVEIAVNQGNAAHEWKIKPGAEVRVVAAR